MKYFEALSYLRFKKDKRFVLIGKESFLKFNFINTAKNIYAPDNLLFLPEDQEDALNLLKSQNFFNDTLLILYNFDEMKVSAFDKIIELFNAPLILMLTEKVDIKSRVMSKIISSFTIVECNKLRDYGSDYPLWIKNQIIDAGYFVLDKVEELIFSKIGPDMFIISSELEKLFIVKSFDKKIDLKDVEKYITIRAVGTLFDLFENLLKRDVVNALKCFNTYTKNQDTFLDVMYFLSSYLEKMFRLHLLLEKKMDVDVIADLIGIHKYLIKIKYQSRVVSLGRGFIASKIDELCKLSQKLVDFKSDKRILIEKFIIGFSL